MISVIIPIYNTKDYLKACVDSVINQTYRDIEILLVDDGSTDGSEKMCGEYAQTDSRIKVIHKKNGGLADARNAGIEKSSGEYLFFIDSDDTIEKDCIEVLYDLIVSTDSDMSLGEVYYVDENDEPIEKHNRTSPVVDEVVTPREYIEKLMLPTSNFYCNACGKIFKKSLFDSIRYPVGRIHEDEAVIHELAYNCKRIAIVKRHFYHYFKRGEGITAQPFSKKSIDRNQAFYERCKFLYEHGMEDLACEFALKQLELSYFLVRKAVRLGVFDKEIGKRLTKYFRYEYKICKNANFPKDDKGFRFIIIWQSLSVNSYAWYFKKFGLKKEKQAEAQQ